MRLEGSLDAFSLPDIFALLAMTAKTGGLHLHRPAGDPQHGVVHFRAGALTGASSDVARQSLARRVVGDGHVDDAALAAAVQLAAEDPAVGVTRALQQAGAVDDARLTSLVSEHVVDAVFDLLRWPDGDFSFHVDEPNPDEVGVTLAVDDVVAEGRRRLEDWPAVVAAIPSPEAVLRVALAPGDEPRLSAEEWALLALVDGRRAVRDLVTLAGRGEYAVARTLAALVERGLLRVDEEGVDALLRRQSLLAPLEGRLAGVQIITPGTPAPAPQPAPEPVAAAPAPAAMGAPEPERAPMAAPEPEPAAMVAPESAPTATATVPGAAPVRVSVPAPAAPLDRVPVMAAHAEPQLVGEVDGANARLAETAPEAAYLDRDPALTRSLLLRLIAGVRGL